jgi:hypothetical protein
MKYSSLVFLASCISFNSLACSFAGWGIFQPSLERWEQHAGPAQNDPTSDGEYWESVPKPIVTVSKISRASYKAGSSCNDSGLIELEVELPSTSTYQLNEFGVYLRVLNGKEPDLIFPDLPIKGRIVGNKMVLLFPWLDMVPSKQYPLDLTLDAALVTNGLNIGKSITFKVQQK